MESPRPQDRFRIGMVGVGRMGANMARRLHEQGYHLAAIYDIDRTQARTLGAELSCPVASSPTEAAASADTVFTVVTDDGAMRALYAEDRTDGLLAHAEGRLFINCATLTPKIHQEIQTLVEHRGGLSLEGCMASSIPQARAGTLYLMCGGRREAFERARPLLESLSAALTYIGPAGEAAKVKALVNMVMNINTAALAEGLGLGAALGLDLTMLREVFSQTGAASRVLETDGEDMQNRDHACFFSAVHAAKDCGIALHLAREAGMSPPLATATFEQYKRLVETGKGELDKSAIAELTFPGRA